MASKFVQILTRIGKATSGSDLNESEIEKIVQQEGFFDALGYKGIGVDILAQRARAAKRFDVALLGLGGRVRAVVEFKQPRAGDLLSYQGELFDKYVIPYLAPIGVLFNGERVIAFRRNGNDVVNVTDF